MTNSWRGMALVHVITAVSFGTKGFQSLKVFTWSPMKDPLKNTVWHLKRKADRLLIEYCGLSGHFHPRPKAECWNSSMQNLDATWWKKKEPYQYWYQLVCSQGKSLLTRRIYSIILNHLFSIPPIPPPHRKTKNPNKQTTKTLSKTVMTCPCEHPPTFLKGQRGAQNQKKKAYTKMLRNWMP